MKAKLNTCVLLLIGLISSCGVTQYREIGFGGGESSIARSKYSGNNRIEQVGQLAVNQQNIVNEPQTIEANCIEKQNELLPVESSRIGKKSVDKVVVSKPKMEKRIAAGSSNHSILNILNKESFKKIRLKDVKGLLQKSHKIESPIIAGFFTAFMVACLVSAGLLLIGLMLILSSLGSGSSGNFWVGLGFFTFGIYAMEIAAAIGLITLILWLVSLA